MRRLPILMVLLLALLPATAGAAKPAKEPGILYSLDAKGATITQSGKAFRLSMPANTSVTWFTDRPARKAGTVRLIDLYGIWDASGFNDDPPNAALLTTHKGVEHTHVVEMTKPQVELGHVSFAIRALPNTKEAGHVHMHDLAAGRVGRARMFIDDAALNPCPATIGPTATFAPMTPTVTQCLLAPSATTKFTWPSISVGYTTVTACNTSGPWFYIPNYAYGSGHVGSTPCTTYTGAESMIVSRGWSTPQAVYNCVSDSYVPPNTYCATDLPDGTPYCPTPRGYFSFSGPAAPASSLRLTITDGRNLQCPQITMTTMYVVSPITTMF